MQPNYHSMSAGAPGFDSRAVILAGFAKFNDARGVFDELARQTLAMDAAMFPIDLAPESPAPARRPGNPNLSIIAASQQGKAFLTTREHRPGPTDKGRPGGRSGSGRFS
jgi:hypothetical protein